MSEFVVFFRDGSSVVVEASGHFAAVRAARALCPHKRVASVQRAYPVHG